MSKNISLAARRALAGVLAATAVAAGIGLAGAGVAEAAPRNDLTCITNLKGTTTVFDHNRQIARANVGASGGSCLSAGEGTESFAISSVRSQDRTVSGQADMHLTHLDPATGSVDVGLLTRVDGPGQVSPFGGYADPILTRLGNGNYRMVSRSDDKAGHVNVTDVTFQVVAH